MLCEIVKELIAVEALPILLVVLDMRAKITIARLAELNALDTGMSRDDWKVRRLCAPNTITADFQMAFDPEGERTRLPKEIKT